MGYPYGPQGGPTPGGYQPPYPQQQAPPYGQPYPHAAAPGGYGPGRPYGPTGFGQPTGGTAVTAALLALGLALLGAYSGLMALDAAHRLERLDLDYGGGPDTTGLQAIGAFSLVVAALWLLGGVLLLARKSAGRALLVVLACIGGLGNLVSGVMSLSSDIPAAGIGSFIGVAIALTILCLALAGSTSRWLAAAPGRPNPMPRPGPYGQPPYGQALYGQAPYGQAPYGQQAAPPMYPYGQAAPPNGQYPPYR